MRFLLAFFLSLFVALPAHAVILSVVEATTTTVTVSNGDGNFTIFFDTLQPGSQARRAAELENRLNAFATQQQLRAGIVIDESTKVEDPGSLFGEKFFWCDADRVPQPNNDVDGLFVCARSDVVEILSWESGGVPLIRVRLARDCAQDPTFPSCQ